MSFKLLLPFFSFLLSNIIFLPHVFSFPTPDSNLTHIDIKLLEWWQQTVIYQVYPRSFKDSDGDGVGDINGLTSKLDYFVDLGVNAIWLSPVYSSPMKDFGYDISNFKGIDPIFGTMEDFKKMVQEFKKRDLKLIMDFVPNHSSDLHEWFQKSINKIDPYTNYYVWRNAKGFDPQGKPIVPNNWVNRFSGSAWTWNEKRQQFYYHAFLKEQPDFDYNNIQVRNEMLAIVKFWLDMGVDGFRVDAPAWLYEDERELDEPADPERSPESTPDQFDYWDHIYTYNQPKDREFLADMYQFINVYSAADGKKRVSLVEISVKDEYIPLYYGTLDKPVSNFPFNFHFLHKMAPNRTASDVIRMIDDWYDVTPDFAWPNFVLTGHDYKRSPTRWTPKGIDGANMINLLLKGTATTYYGEEIGMKDAYLTWEETVDPQACNQDPSRYLENSRDTSRTPMQWDDTKNAGFSSANKTWLPLNENYVKLNVEAQKKADESHLKVYKALVKLRSTNAWRYGDYESRALNDDRVLGFTRIAPREVDSKGFLVLVNLSNDSAHVNATVFKNVPADGHVYTRSVGFEDKEAVIGSAINLTSIFLGARNSIVVQFLV